MNKLRVFQNVYQRGTVQEFSRKNFCTVLLLLFFLPYVLSSLLGSIAQAETEDDVVMNQILRGESVVKNRTQYGSEEIPLELYVADKLTRTIDNSYEKEALKAQAVLIRTNLLRDEKEQIILNDEYYGTEDISEECLLATAETRGMILEYENKPIYGAYFKNSSGYTRDAAESGLPEDYPYLTGVPCSRDYTAQGNVSAVTYAKESFERIWKELAEAPAEQVEKVLQKQEKQSLMTEKVSAQMTGQLSYARDSAGYVVFLAYGGKWVSGEEVRYYYDLASADFYIKEDGNDFVFEVSGEGHGFGMSQFAANEMAKEGNDFLNILTYFFKDVTLMKVKG